MIFAAIMNLIMDVVLLLTAPISAVTGAVVENLETVFNLNEGPCSVFFPNPGGAPTECGALIQSFSGISALDKFFPIKETFVMIAITLTYRGVVITYTALRWAVGLIPFFRLPS